MQTAVQPVEEALADQQSELSNLLSGLSAAEWDKPSPCEGWTVADVVLHLAQTNEMAIASAEDRLWDAVGELGGGAAGNVDEGADQMVASERGVPPEAIRGRWQSSAATFAAVVTESDPHKRVTWVAGQLSVRTLATTRLAETWIHTGDVAVALGTPLAPTSRLWHISRLAWRTLPYAFARAGHELSGPVAFELRGPSGEDWDFLPSDGDALTVVRGSGEELCLVAGRRADPAATGLASEGPDGDAVLELVRTYA